MENEEAPWQAILERTREIAERIERDVSDAVEGETPGFGELSPGVWIDSRPPQW
ncbi:hypothetical protein [Marinitenerispora sediminis]|uniref:hypothetical protein n=1 Tax=Marinitenerispora sediminis TaxID=1931232 RepID=UPI0015F1672A|nr:hypothetical protein [Marinitenerispora sediminis]